MKKNYIIFIVIMLLSAILTSCGKTGILTNPKLPVTEPDVVSETPVSDPARWVDLHVVGDVMMDSVIGDYIAAEGVDYPWSDVTAELSQADIAVANLETSVSIRGSTKKPAGYGFRSHPKTLLGVKNSGIDLVSLANNHTLDFGTDALADTISSLNEYGIRHTGAGSNIREAEQLAILTRNELKVGFLSFTSIIPNQSWIATEDLPGIAPLKPKYYERVLERIKAANEQCDILVVLLHWGKEHSNQVEQWQRELAQKMIDNGADAIIGHHPHVLRGIEFFQNKPIIYSIGNFIFLKRDDKAGQTAIFKMRLSKDGFVQGSIRPVHIQYAKANLLGEDSELSKKIIAEMQELSQPLGTTFTVSGDFFPSEN